GPAAVPPCLPPTRSIRAAQVLLPRGHAPVPDGRGRCTALRSQPSAVASPEPGLPHDGDRQPDRIAAAPLIVGQRDGPVTWLSPVRVPRGPSSPVVQGERAAAAD